MSSAPDPQSASSATDGKAESPEQRAAQFAAAAQEEQPGIVSEFIEFLRESKAWWLTPIIIVLLLLGVLLWFAGSAVAPFIYTIF